MDLDPHFSAAMDIPDGGPAVGFVLPAPGVARSDALGRAHATLAAGCAFLLRNAGGRAVSPTDVFARLQGNRLRELDRFLSILLDEIALAVRAPGHDAPGFARLHNTANKLRLVEGMHAAERCAAKSHAQDGRLRAIGRISACLNHCSGVVHAPRVHRDLALAGGGEGRKPAMFADSCAAPDRIRLCPETLDAIVAFYREIGDRLLIEAHEARPQP